VTNLHSQKTVALNSSTNEAKHEVGIDEHGLGLLILACSVV
jgi:hypothetical protein